MPQNIGIPAITSSTELHFWSTCWMRPTSVLICRFRTLFLRMAVNMLQISAWQVMLHCSNSSTMQPILRTSWIMKFVSRSNSPPTNWKVRWDTEPRSAPPAFSPSVLLRSAPACKWIFQVDTAFNHPHEQPELSSVHWPQTWSRI